jgi:hypothetical protein
MVFVVLVALLSPCRFWFLENISMNAYSGWQCETTKILCLFSEWRFCNSYMPMYSYWWKKRDRINPCTNWYKYVVSFLHCLNTHVKVTKLAKIASSNDGFRCIGSPIVSMSFLVSGKYFNERIFRMTMWNYEDFVLVFWMTIL